MRVRLRRLEHWTRRCQFSSSLYSREWFLNEVPKTFVFFLDVNRLRICPIKDYYPPVDYRAKMFKANRKWYQQPDGKKSTTVEFEV